MASQSKPESGKWRKLFVAEGQLRPVWQLVLYLPMLAAAAAIIILPVTTLLRVMGLPASVYTEAPYSIAGLARRTMSVGITISVIVAGTWAWQRFVRKRNMARLGLSLRRGWLSDLSIGVFLGISLTGLIFVVELCAGWCRNPCQRFMGNNL